jgi:glycosyltransferase involved in cell wall biosynthesis
MRIAVVNQPFDGVLPPNQNSIGIWTYETARRLSDRHDITVHAPHTPSLSRIGVGRRLTQGGIVYRFGRVAPAASWSKLWRLWDRVFPDDRPIFASVFYYLEYSFAVALRLWRERPDIIHIHNFTGFVPVVRFFNRRAGIVLHMNGEWLSQLDEATMARRIGLVDAVFGSSDYITNLVRVRFPQFAGRCHTVYNGVDPDAFVASSGEPGLPGARPEATGPVVVFVGRLSPEKGLHDLLDALPEVVARHPTVRFDIIGPEGVLPKSFIVDVSEDPTVQSLARFYERDYRELLEERIGPEVKTHVRFLGGLPHGEVVQHVRDADLVVNPSYSESFGMSLVEALACQTPVVATRVGGMPEIVGDDAGLLVDRADPPALAAAISRMLDDPEMRRRMGEAGRRRVENVFAWSRVAQRAEAQYDALLAKSLRR